jgi:glycosyltransferase involved in cell wall biosynthesis
MRICLVTREYPPLTRFSGGIGRAFATLAPALAADGHEVHALVVGLDGVCTSADEVQIHGLGGMRLTHPGPLTRLAAAVATRQALARLGRFDVVYAPEWSGDAAACGARPDGLLVTNLATSLSQVRAASPDTRRVADLRPHRLAQAMLEQRQARRSSGIVAPSRAVLEWARRLWSRVGPLPSRIIPNPVELSSVTSMSRGEPPEGFPQDAPTVTFAGRLERLKGVHVLVDSMAEVWDAVPNVRLVFFGPDAAWRGRGMRQYLSARAGARADRLVFLGEQPPDRLYPAFAASTVVVVPSFWESFGNVALEAQAVGTAVIGTRDTGLADLIEHERSGLLVGRGRRKELATSILRLIVDDALRERIGAAAQTNARRFDAPRIAREHVDFFRFLQGE